MYTETAQRTVAPDTRELKRDPEWLELISHLRANKNALVHDFKSRFPAASLYSELVPVPEIDALVEDTMEMYLVLLSGEHIDPALERLPFNLGRDRARQGVPSEQLLEGVRTNSRVIWNALRGITTEASAIALVRNTDAVLSLVEWHTRAVQSSYLREEELLNRDSERRRRRAISRLFGDGPLDAVDFMSVSSVLGFSDHQKFDVAVQLGPHLEDCLLCANLNTRTMAHELSAGVCHFRSSGSSDFLSELHGHHAAVVNDIDGLAEIPAAVRAGLSLARSRVLREPDPVTFAMAWPEVAWGALTATVPERLLPIALGALQSLNNEERDRILGTVSLYLETGSIKSTAESLYCHRNTIVKRLARFESLTELNISVPKQAALALLALTAFKPQRN